MAHPKIVVTGTGAVCASGMQPAAIYEHLLRGETAIGPIGQWDTTGWPVTVAGEIADFNPRALVDDRKLHKLIRRTDLLGLYAAARAIETSGLIAHRTTLDEAAAAVYSDRCGVYVGSGGGNYQNQYDFFPLMTEAQGTLPAFGRELGNAVNPMWLLRTLPNNVLGHIGIQHGLKGPNACVTDHSAGGVLAIIEAMEGLRQGEADRAVAVGHDAPIEPQMQLYYQRVGLLAAEALRPFDVRHDGSLFGEGAAALVLETAAAAAARGAPVLGEILGGGVAGEALGLLGIRDDGDGVARAIELALADAGIAAADVGMIVAHGNGTRLSDSSEAAALRRVFGAAMPPVTAFKWAFGHLIAAAGTIDTVLALEALARGEVPGLATLAALDPDCAPLPVSRATVPARSNVALIVNRGFAATDAALVVRAG
ncbi:MAG: 3-oxoacyl-ACP synthase [Betaproteobacteria bacterium]|nr:3-oxoacyl-ACP synthase [Betaproteobacteria bacterium]MBK7591606.1 3-oxoacyl-ACP synthase [Betaproteobacteria bacterium]MBK8690553.1 3-oxoacyl-ACP synthase [Betaproteobacteria bacterium]